MPTPRVRGADDAIFQRPVAGVAQRMHGLNLVTSADITKLGRTGRARWYVVTEVSVTGRFINAAVLCTALSGFVACGGSGTSASFLTDGGAGDSGASGSAGWGTGGSSGTGGSAGAVGDAAGGAAGGSPDAGEDAKADACIETTFEQTIQPLAAYILLDNSGSMYGDKLTDAKNGLTTFFGAPASAGIDVALGFFPGKLSSSASCEPSLYETPAVGFGLLSSDTAPSDVQEQALAAALADLTATGLTPMYAAMLGAWSTATTRATQTQSDAIVLLISDGDPAGCPSSTNNVQNIIDTAAAFAGATPSIKTHTVGLPGSNQITLGAIAKDGQGTFHDLGATFSEQKLVEVINEIRIEALPCDLPLPKLDPNTLSVGFVSGNGVQTDLIRVDNEALCSLHGWYLATDPTTGQPDRMVLCSDVCTATQNDPKSKIVVSAGCG